MRMLLNKKFLVAAFAVSLIAVGLSLVDRSSAAAFHGAIYTSNIGGTIVNQNLYDAKTDVYLNGGPQGVGSNGLPNGTYYYQVTNPNGSVLLSTDNAVCRQLTVSGGRVAGAAGPCPHLNGLFNSANGSTSVQLAPFNDTPNNGGEYKVWLIRQASTTTISPDLKHINFSNSNAKTDNFKVRAEENCETNPTLPICNPDPPDVFLSGHKFYDANANSLDDDGQSVEGVQIVISYSTMAGDFGPFTTTTDANGDWTFGPIPAGAVYTVSENLPCVDDNNDLNCDANKYWVQTAPVADSEGFQGYSGTANVSVGGLNFGDICFGPASGGLTKGFWGNKNGQGVMTTGGPNGVDPLVYLASAHTPNSVNGDLAFLTKFNLKGEAAIKKQVVTMEFDPGSYNDFKSWLQASNAYNMSYMLSAQLAATSLDVRHKYLFDSQIVDARGVCNGVGSCLGFESIGNIRRLANESLDVLNGGDKTISGDPHRDSQELLKDFLDDVNNNLLPFASATPCSVFYPVP